MISKTALSLVACMVAAGCAPGPYDSTGAAVAYPNTATMAPIPPVPPEPALQLRSAGSVVGLPVIDAAGQPVGTVQAVAAVRQTGEIRDLIIASPHFGLGYYISVPAASAQSLGDHVVLNAPPGAWMQAPRLASQQISEMYGAY